MERQAAQRIPKWKVNARTQVHKLAKDNLMNFRDLPFQWNDLLFNIGPIIAELRLIDDESALMFRFFLQTGNQVDSGTSDYEFWALTN